MRPPTAVASEALSWFVAVAVTAIQLSPLYGIGEGYATHILAKSVGLLLALIALCS
jgi:hypothetical protein